MTKRKGAVLYRGPSAIDGSPIVVVATGLEAGGSKNLKTGGMVQTWILADTPESPYQVAQSGADRSVCGDCPHRGTVEWGRNVGRSCYVTLIHGPRGAHAKLKRGGYPQVAWEGLAPLFRGRVVRIGAYGDPGAVPDAARFWSEVVREAKAWTGYTHRWRDTGEGLQGLVMASADSLGDYEEAKARGWRTFRVMRAAESALPGAEVICPASAEAGKRTTCMDCTLCMGQSRPARDVAIVVHGTGTKHFVGRKLPTV